MSSGIPVQIQAQKAIANAIALEGSLELSSMTRLHAFLVKYQGRVSARLEFGRDEGGAACVQGRLQSEVVMQCQRCLGEVHHDLDAEVNLRLFSADVGMSDEEGIEITDDPLMVHELIEDELILALPAVAMHENAQDCEQSEVPQDYLKQEAHNERNPFAVLAQLKTE